MTDFAVVDPSTGRTVKEYPTISDAALQDALESADRAHRDWASRVTVTERADLIRNAGRLHIARKQQLAEAMVREMGKPIAQAIGEVEYAAAVCDFYADNAEALMADEHIELMAGSGTAFVRRSSLGVVLGIMPWNYPCYQITRFAVPSLMIGNTVLVKHAPQCPESAELITQIMLSAGFPDGAYVNLYATHEQIESVIADPRVQGVSFTGSARAGATVAALAGQHLKKVVLELGGSDPFVLLATNDLDSVVEQAVAARLENSGQSCNAAKRFIIMDEYYEPFVEKFVRAMAAIKPGDPRSAESEIGPLSSRAAADRLQNQLDRAVAQGAKLLGGGEREGNFVSPAVLVDVSRDNDVYREELFGPIAQVFRVSSEKEAIDLANDTPFGLGSYIMTNDRAQALRVADQIEAGMVFVNLVLAEGVELPFGGVKRSGFGRELGRYGADEFVNKKLIRMAE